MSPNDQYIIYYDADSGQMQWLAYTVTYGKEGKSDKFSYIRYNDWKSIYSLILPNSMTWYKVEEGKPTEVARVIEFDDVIISEDAPENSIFGMPEGAKIIE